MCKYLHKYHYFNRNIRFFTAKYVKDYIFFKNQLHGLFKFKAVYF